MKLNYQIKHGNRGFTLVELLVVIVIIASLAGLTAPMVIRQRKKADQTEATNNARQIGLAMFEFETEYGSFPDGETADEVLNEQAYTLGTSTSNDYFRQLMAADITQSETMFFAKSQASGSKPDGNINGAAALEGGEVGFGYLMDTGNVGLSTAGNPGRVIVATPMLSGSSTDFDPDPYDKKAVVLRIDNSVNSISINQSNKAILVKAGSDSKTLLDNGNDTVWGSNITPIIVPPEE